MAALPPDAYGATLTIDLAALADNWRLLRDRARGAECGAVIKADAYGCGIGKVAPALAKAGCRTFFVAHLSEAATARAVLPSDALVYVLNGLLPGSAAAYGLIGARPVLGSRAEIDEWLKAGGGPCVLHVDTGMNRLGLSLDELKGMAHRIGTDIDADFIMTHFSGSEDVSDPANARQIKMFAVIADILPGMRLSLLNSSGHFLPGAPAHHLTRPGYALYGGNPTPGRSNPMKPVVTLTASILQVREIEDGTGVGYNSRWHARGRRRIATISTGYADGYPRNGSSSDAVSGGAALVGGLRCPFAGTVSMDLIILDVTDAPASAVKRGAPVTLIGGELDIDAVGLAARTIGYEILTGLGRRYRRVYVS